MKRFGRMSLKMEHLSYIMGAIWNYEQLKMKLVNLVRLIK